MKEFIYNSIQLTRYNLKIIFKERFLYFILSAILFYILTVGISLFTDGEITQATGYTMLLVPGILLIFYPTCFGIQNDQDCKIIEILFGIPNYRYKIWLVRLLLTVLLCFSTLFVLAYITDLLVVEIPPLSLTVEVLFPTCFIGMLAFALSTIIRNGNGTAVVILIIGLLLFILHQNMELSRWNIFLNPYNIPNDTNPIIFSITYRENRIIILIASILLLLIGLVKTQQRERFI